MAFLTKYTLAFGVKLFSILAVFLISVPFVYYISTHRPTYGVLLIIGILGLAAIIISLLKPKYGFVILFLFCSFIFIILRLIHREDIPYGIVKDIFIGVIFIGIIIERYFKNKSKWITGSPITIILTLFTLYLILQAFNPNGSRMAWLMGMRGYFSYIIVYIILLHTLKDYHSIVRFTKLWVIVFFLAALYACYQEWFGLPDYDLRWVTANPKRIGLNWSYGRWDKWSFMSDIAAFGLMMSFSTVFLIVLAMGPFKKSIKFIFLIAGGFMFIAMIFSGNRTAYASFPFGLLLFGILAMNNPKILGLSILMGIILLFVVFGPFYGGAYVTRLRSAFQPEDVTLQLRDRNRAFVQPYIHSHAIGGGFLTTGDFGKKYSPNHELSGFPTDSLYLESALELGWIGLFFRIVIYFIVLMQGVSGYFASRNDRIRFIYLAYTCAFFSLTIAAYAKKALNQIPLGLVLMGIYVIMDKLIKYENDLPAENNVKGVG